MLWVFTPGLPVEQMSRNYALFLICLGSEHPQHPRVGCYLSTP